MLYDCSPALPSYAPVLAIPGHEEPSVAWLRAHTSVITLPRLGAGPAHRSLDSTNEALETLIGPARVVEVFPSHLDAQGLISDRVLPNFEGTILPRLILKVHRLAAEYGHLSFAPEFVERLESEGYLLVAIDQRPTAESDPFEGIRENLASSGVALIEGITLDHVPNGDYVLMALPPNVVGADSSAVRVILRGIQ